MNKRQIRQFEMLQRAQKFGAAHRDRFPDGSGGAKCLADLGAAVAKLQEATEAKVTIRNAGRAAKHAAKAGLVARLVAIADTARVLAKDAPEIDDKFPSSIGRSDVAVLTTARAFVGSLEPVKAAFVQQGLAESFLVDLQHATEMFAQALSGSHSDRTRNSVASSSIRAALRKGANAVDSLDVIVANIFDGEHDIIEEWARDRRVDASGKTGPVKPPVPEAVTAPAAPTTEQPEAKVA